MKEKPLHEKVILIASLLMALIYIGGGVYLISSSLSFNLLPVGSIQRICIFWHTYFVRFLPWVQGLEEMSYLTRSMKYLFSAGIGISLCVLVLMSGCSKTSSKERDNPVQGTITIAADESFKPLVYALTQAYQGIYPRAHFNVVYEPEQKAILELLKDSVRMVFTTRPLSENEISMVKQQEGIQKAHHIALDGLALVVNGSNPG